MQVEELPKYEVVKRAIIADIEGRRLRPGAVVPSEAELQERFKVSRPTLVRSLQDLVREGYVYRQQGRGTFVADRTGADDAIVEEEAALSVFVSSYTARLTGDAHEVLLRLVRGIESHLRSAGRKMMLHTVDADGTGPEVTAYLDRTEPGPALVIEPSFNQPLWSTLVERGWQAWAVNEPLESANCVLIDHEHAGYLATRHLLQQGRRRVALLNGRRSDYWGFAARWRGYRRALDEAGISYDAALVQEASHVVDSEAGRQMMRELLDARTQIDAAVGVSDAKAIGAMAAADERGVRIPEQIAFASIDNIIADRAPMPLVSVSMPFEALGARAVQMALDPVEIAPGVYTEVLLKPTIQLPLTSET